MRQNLAQGSEDYSAVQRKNFKFQFPKNSACDAFSPPHKKQNAQNNEKEPRE